MAALSNTAAAGPLRNADCVITRDDQDMTIKLTIHDVDEACCAECQKASNVPECVKGKSFEADVSKAGGACTGSLCEPPVPPPQPAATITSLGLYDLSAECCAFVHTHSPPVPADCPPASFCMHEEGIFTAAHAPMPSFRLAFLNTTQDMAALSNTAAAGPLRNADCVITRDDQDMTTKLTIHDVDEACCAECQKASNVPECVKGKSFEADVCTAGGACTGSLCELPVPPPQPAATITSLGLYDLSAECCAFLHTHSPPVPVDCPPASFSMHEEGTFTAAHAPMPSFNLAFLNTAHDIIVV